MFVKAVCLCCVEDIMLYACSSSTSLVIYSPF